MGGAVAVTVAVTVADGLGAVGVEVLPGLSDGWISVWRAVGKVAVGAVTVVVRAA